MYKGVGVDSLPTNAKFVENKKCGSRIYLTGGGANSWKRINVSLPGEVFKTKGFSITYSEKKRNTY